MDAAQVEQLLDANPRFKGKLMQFMALYDAADILRDISAPSDFAMPDATWTRYYLQRTANQIMEDAGVPEEFILAMVKARPPGPWRG